MNNISLNLSTKGILGNTTNILITKGISNNSYIPIVGNVRVLRLPTKGVLKTATLGLASKGWLGEYETIIPSVVVTKQIAGGIGAYETYYKPKKKLYEPVPYVKLTLKINDFDIVKANIIRNDIKIQAKDINIYNQKTIFSASVFNIEVVSLNKH